MFGGLCFLLRGNMCCGVLGDDLVLRVDPTRASAYIKEMGARPMDFTGRPMRNFLYVSKKACATAAGLKKWLSRGVDYASSLAPKA